MSRQEIVADLTGLSPSTVDRLRFIKEKHKTDQIADAFIGEIKFAEIIRLISIIIEEEIDPDEPVDANDLDKTIGDLAICYKQSVKLSKELNRNVEVLFGGSLANFCRFEIMRHMDDIIEDMKKKGLRR